MNESTQEKHKEKGKLFTIIFEMADLWDTFLNEGKTIQVSLGDAINLMHFNKKFTELKQYVGYLK